MSYKAFFKSRAFQNKHGVNLRVIVQGEESMETGELEDAITLYNTVCFVHYLLYGKLAKNTAFVLQ